MPSHRHASSSPQPPSPPYLTPLTHKLTLLKPVETPSPHLNKSAISQVTITSTLTLEPSEISEAVAEAGYLVVANNA